MTKEDGQTRQTSTPSTTKHKTHLIGTRSEFLLQDQADQGSGCPDSATPSQHQQQQSRQEPPPPSFLAPRPPKERPPLVPGQPQRNRSRHNRGRNHDRRPHTCCPTDSALARFRLPFGINKTLTSSTGVESLLDNTFSLLCSGRYGGLGGHGRRGEGTAIRVEEAPYTGGHLANEADGGLVSAEEWSATVGA